MAGSTNFVQVNPGAANQQNDATYDSDVRTTGGVGVNAILPSPWLNKVWFQSSTFIAALAAVIAGSGPGYTITDTNIATLETELTAFFASIAPGSLSLANPGYITLPGGLLVQWGNSGSVANDTPTAIVFPKTFPNACFGAIATDNFLASKSATWSTYGFLTTGFTIRCDGNTAGATWFAFGW